MNGRSLSISQSYERSLTSGHDVVTVDPFTGKVHVLFVANPGKNARPVSGLERILERKRNWPTRLFRLEVLRNRGGHGKQGE